MVVGQTPIIFASALPPLHFSTRMCSLPATAQGYPTPPGTTVSSPTMPCAPSSLTPPDQCILPSSPLTPPSSAGSPPLLPPVTYPSAVLYTPIPVTGMSVMPMNPALTIQCKAPDNHNISSPDILPCNGSAYACTQPMPPSGIVPCQPRMINGTVLQCTPGLCQFSMPAVTYTNNNQLYTNNNQLYNIPQPTIPQSIAHTVCSTNVVSPWKQSYGMEQVWRKEFSNLFYNYTRTSQHLWTLLPVTERPGGLWYENVDSAKVRFCCDACGHGWTSMKGRVAFWFILNYATNEGVVCLKLYGQQCDRCKRGDYEPAMWYPEEVIKVMVNIYNKVGQVYYGFAQAPYHKTRRPGKPRTPHNSDLCQACKDGVCAERR